MPPLPPFPSVAPFRIDQVMAAPLAMALLALAQLALAGLMSWAAQRGRPGLWRAAAAALLLLVAVFFTLASWGNSDTTKLSHFFGIAPGAGTKGEPFWVLVGPLVLTLPYRMALVHGLVAAGYAAAPLLLARAWGARAWAGWWSLLVVCSPLLRNFLQNGVSRQALLTLLLLPLLLWAGRLVRLARWPLVAATIGAATVHTSFPPTLLLALLPRLAAGASAWRLGGPSRWRLVLPLLAGLLLLVGLVAPNALEKLRVYSEQESYFNRYALGLDVARLQLSLVLGVLLGCWRRRLGWRRLLACDRSRQLVLFALLFWLLQSSLATGWMAPITSRLADALGFYLLILWLAWLDRYRCHWAALPALAVTLDYWLQGRLLSSLTLACGFNDDFLCIPDRWPWQLRY